tara:strand:- start:431 stop:1189 length:759 start_codon:yes stop_codon:yes gene_type:complete
MQSINKFLERLVRFCRYLMSDKYKLYHKYQNKNQITDTNFILNSLKTKDYIPKYVVDVGCGYGEWTKKMMKYYKNSNYLLFDADETNKEKLDKLIKINNNISYQITLLSDDDKDYQFYKMGYGSSIYEEQTTHKREIKNIKSKKLINLLPKELENSDNNMIKLDVQGSELRILNGLEKLLNKFEVIILETSIHQYNKDAPLFNEILDFMSKKEYKLYDLFDFKRLGNYESFLLQFDCVFVRKDSNLLKVKFI